MERHDPQTIRQIIDAVMDRSASRDAFLDHRAAALWADVAGADINRQTSRRYCAKGVLHVYITSAPLKTELSFLRETLARRINDILGKEVVTQIAIH